MDGTAAINHNHEALRRILATLLAMAGLGASLPSSLRGSEGRARHAARPGASGGGSLPRHLYRAILRLLRPAESATRRLAIALALAMPSPQLKAVALTGKGPQARKPTELILRRGVGTGIVLPYGAPVPASLAHLVPPKPARTVGFPLLDPLRHPFRRRQPVAACAPRISFPGYATPSPIPVRSPPSPDDRIDATHLGQRLAALGRALDDLPALARRFARWQARRAQKLVRRIWPLRPGRPPGSRLSRFDPLARRGEHIREVDEIAVHAHALAIFALERRDTS